MSPSLDSLPDNEDAKKLLSCYRLLEPGSSAEAMAQRCTYRRDNLVQRNGIVVDTDTEMVDAFVHSDMAASAASSSAAPKVPKGQALAPLPPASALDSNKGANDLRDQETGAVAPGGD